MKITLCTVGSRGDIQPMLALAIEAQQRGHEVQEGFLLHANTSCMVLNIYL